jgi:hypothetical protein
MLACHSFACNVSVVLPFLFCAFLVFAFLDGEDGVFMKLIYADEASVKQELDVLCDAEV